MASASVIPHLGLGISGALGWPYITPRRDALALIRAAHEEGLRYFDTGHSYCGGEAEVTLGIALKEIGRERIFLSTKLGTLASGRLGRVRQSFDHSVMAHALETSLSRLGCGQVDLLMLHSPPSDQLARGLDYLCLARSQGMTNLIGASITQDQIGLQELDRCDVVMVKHSISRPLMPEHANQLRQRGTSIIAKRALAQDSGRLRDLLPKSLKRADLWYALRMLKHRLEGHGDREPQLHCHADRLAFALKTTDCVLFGSTRIEHVRANIAIARDLGLLDAR
jgi:aryl-alcohol dehydrogenase-like predicted oxidoreductase